jgi:hypothetical protein
MNETTTTPQEAWREKQMQAREARILGLHSNTYGDKDERGIHRLILSPRNMEVRAFARNLRVSIGITLHGDYESPSIYRESGPDVVQLIRDINSFMQANQLVHKIKPEIYRKTAHQAILAFIAAAFSCADKIDTYKQALTLRALADDGADLTDDAVLEKLANMMR